jgi:hypothetical protein
MSIMILEPLENDDALLPVVVRAGYSHQNAFNLTCKVHNVPESPPQNHVGEDVHISGNITIAAGTYTVYADGDNSAGNDSQNNVRVTSGLVPIEDVTIIEEPGPEPTRNKGNGGKKKFKVTGKCDPKKAAAYVICRVFEVDVKKQTRTRKAVGAASTEGNNLSWKVVVEFAPDASKWIAYVAQVTAYNLDEKPVGQVSKYFKK